ncbi:MAG TPA: outer membrane protein assembly factor BamD [Candidatus Binataceae bacterium]
MRRALVTVVALSLLPMFACSLRKPPTGEDFYAQGQRNFTDHEYSPAIENYQRLIDQYPFSPYAEDAEMKIGLAHYQMKDYAEAVGALDDFQRMHPTSKNLDLVDYYIAMSYYDQIGREDQDQTKTAAALKRFEEIEQRFPEGNFAALAQEHVSVCREMLARHELIVSNFYYNRANFKAAESRLAEVMQKYPDTPIAPDALFELGQALEKQGKKYSAAQAFAAELRHFPDTPYTPKAKAELKKLHQQVDTEEDPLPLVLAETGYGANPDADAQNHVVVRQRSDSTGDFPLVSAAPAYGPDGLPNLDAPKSSAAPGPPAAAEPAPSGAQMLKTIRLSSANPPMSVIFDLTGPVQFDKHLESGPGFSTAVVLLKGVRPDVGLGHHLVFDRSIFKDCDVQSSSQGTTVTVNTVPVTNFAVVPLDGPPRLLVTFTPSSQNQAMGSSVNTTF